MKKLSVVMFALFSLNTFAATFSDAKNEHWMKDAPAAAAYQNAKVDGVTVEVKDGVATVKGMVSFDMAGVKTEEITLEDTKDGKTEAVKAMGTAANLKVVLKNGDKELLSGFQKVLVPVVDGKEGSFSGSFSLTYKVEGDKAEAMVTFVAADAAAAPAAPAADAAAAPAAPAADAAAAPAAPAADAAAAPAAPAAPAADAAAPAPEAKKE